MLIMFFKGNAFREFVMPNTDNTNYSIVLDKELFGLSEDVDINMENTSKIWYINSTDKCFVSCNGLFKEHIKLENEMLLNIETGNRELITALAVDVEVKFSVFRKYMIPDNLVVSIGNNYDNMIRYNITNLISSYHCQLEFCRGSVTIRDTSRNGVFVNHRKINGSHNIRSGETIDIFGLKIVVIGDIMCLGTSFGQISISDMLEAYRFEIPQTIDKIKHIPSKIQYFNRSPRVFPDINKGTVKIEPPPDPQVTKKKPLFNIIGPSFTMAIPMMLGTGMSIFSSMYSGSSSSAFMFTGIITAVGSAVLGALWAVMNLRQTRREEIENENQRYDIYGQYLVDITEKIKQQYIENEQSINKLYPSAEQCVKYGRESECLWNRNFFHKDFLYYRLGLGNMPFQVDISVPESKFSMIRDNMKEKPKYIYDQFHILKNVPVGIDLGENRLVGIVGSTHDTFGIIDVLIAQIAANNSYTDVKIALCSSRNYSEGHDRWNYVKNLPHNRTSTDAIRFYASDNKESSNMLYELANIIRHRADDTDKKEFVKPHIILFVTDVKLLENELIDKYIFYPEKKLGLTTIIAAEHIEELPNSCNMIIEKSKRFSGMYNVMSTDGKVQEIVFDSVHKSELAMMAKRLSNIPINEVENESGIPNKLDFFDMLGITRLEDLNILDSWCKNRTYNNMRAVIGKKGGGLDCYLDIYEKYHGPHGLVAGTTGSGKSEILQTYILSLAANFSPEDVAFFIIDFKGGGMANLFTDLPHLIGSISNLAGNQIKRAMISIKSENNRRQMLFNEYGVNNIDAYTRLYKNGETKTAIPHLIIIIDEFAEMKREGSEYINELISVAQIGRSLGVHLILATQKPSGTVSENIWSNSKFRLCLRVQDRNDSTDMLKKPDAAYITQAGRCYLQVGNDELYELFQSGWSGAIYDPDKSNKSSIATMITHMGKTAVVGNYIKLKKKEQEKIIWFTDLLRAVAEAAINIYSAVNFEFLKQSKNSFVYDEISKYAAEIIRKKGYNFEGSDSDILCLKNFMSIIPFEYGTDLLECDSVVERMVFTAQKNNLRMPEVKEKTQLEAVVEYIAETAEKNNYYRQNSLWLPELPPKILLEELVGENYGFNGRGWDDSSGVFSLEAVFGKYDDPENQAQLIAEINLESAGHIALCGAVTSGKSTFLQTFVYSLLLRYSPSFINFYFLDFSSNMFSCFETYPHVGGVINSNSVEKIDKFFNMILRIIDKRKHLFGVGNYQQYIKTSYERVPAIVIIIDNYANFKDKTSNKYEDTLIRVSRDGITYGIYLITSSAGFGINELTNRIADNMKTTIALNMGDKMKFLDVFRNVRPNVFPDDSIKGRGLINVNDRLLEFQTALAVDSENDYERNDKIKALGKTMDEVWTGNKAEPIPFIPENPTMSDFVSNPEYKSTIEDNNSYILPFGYVLSDASLYGLSMSDTYCYTILGKAQSGKSNIIKLLMYSAYRKQGNIVVYEKSTDLFEEISSKYGALYIKTDRDLYEYIKNDLIDIFKKRNSIKKDCIANGMSEDEIFEVMSREKPLFIFIENLKEFFQTAYKPEQGVGAMSGTLENFISKGRLHNIFFIGCMNTEDYGIVSTYSLYNIFTSHKTGVLVGSSPNTQKVFTFQNMTFNEQNKALKKGVALATNNKEENLAVRLVIPLVRRNEM